jgi:Wings apart-like protein regulation of heterochromatin
MQDTLAFAGLEDLLLPETGNEGVQEEEEENSGVKSWHELKRGGEDKRLLDEMEDLIEESKAGGRLGLRRSSVFQIMEKLLQDVAWRRKLKALGLMSIFIQNVVDDHSDPVSRFPTCVLLTGDSVTFDADCHSSCSKACSSDGFR